MRNSSLLEPVRCAELAKAGDTVDHGFFTRKGGVSEGLYKGLNVGLGSNDDRNNILENRSRVAAYFDLPADQFLTPYQVHSCDVAIIDEDALSMDRPRLDGYVTAKPKIAIGVLTADCGPVLFADRENRVVGACHAGWKGATGGILETTIQKMESVGASREKIVATLGPTISQANYEVGPEFAERLLSMSKANENYLIASEKPDHAMFDLPGYIVDRLKSAGVQAQWTGNCTYANEESYFSYRRTTHLNEADYGRQVAVIMLKPTGN